jgi:signal-transduction protein with cAMP-binding, CBS, and nucleotidyltransferase domain
MLHHEEITWMAEIMTQEIATIQVDDYAMKAAINMTIMETDRVYVLDDKKLVGIIKLDHFLKKVLRP